MGNVLTNHKFVGMDTYQNPGDLPNGGVTLAWNVYLEGGDYKTRPGIKGILTTPLPNPCYSVFPYVKADFTEQLIFASGPANSATGGKIYQVPSAGGTPTEILDASNGNASFNINAEAFRIALAGNYAYMVWGATLYRTNLTSSTATVIVSLNPPVVAPSASLSNLPLDTLLSTSGFSSDTLASASAYMTTSQTLINAAANGNVTPGTTLGGTAPNTWTAIAPTPGIAPANNTVGLPGGNYATLTDFYGTATTKWFALDDPGGGFSTGLLPVGALLAPEAYRNATQFYFSFYDYTSDIRSLQSLKIICTAYNSSSAVIGSQSATFTRQFSGQNPGQYFENVFSFAGLGTTIAFVQFSCVGGDNNVNASQFPNFQGFVFASGFYMRALSATSQITFAEAATGGVTLTHVEPSAAFWGRLGGIYITKDYGGGNLQNWSVSPVITFELASAPGAGFTVAQLVTMGLQMNLILRQSASTTEYIAPLTVSADGTYMTTNLSAYIPQTIYASFEYLSIEFLLNLTTSATTSALFTITGITQAGNLPVSSGSVQYAPITYQVEELNSFGDVQYLDPLESSGGPVSNALNPTAVFAIGQIVIPAPINPTTTAFAVFRGGGTYSDGLLRLIATVPLGSDYTAPVSYSDLVIVTPGTKVSSAARPFVSGDVGKVLYILAGTGFTPGPVTISSVTGGVATLSASVGVTGSTAGIAQLAGDPLIRDLQNPYVTWNHTTRTLTDNTPDSFLNLSLTLQYGRDLPPTGCNGVIFHQNRIWVWSGQTLSASWSLLTDAQNGIYFTVADISTDPYIAGKGYTFNVGYGDNDNINSALSSGSSLMVNKSRSVAVVDGYDASNFACQSYLVSAGTGNVASKAAAICGDSAKAWFLGADNVYQFDGNTTEPQSVPIQPLLHPNGYDGGSTIATLAYSKCAMMYYDLRLFLFAPVAGGSTNSVAYVYDFRNSSWAVWALAMTGGASLTGASSSTLGAFMGGLDGQIYTFGAGGDKATPAASQVAIPATLVSRGFGEETAQFSASGESGFSFIEENKPTRMFVMGNVPASTALTFFCYADNNQAVQFSEAYTVGGKFVAQKYIAGVQGTQIFAGVSGSFLTQGIFRALGVEVEKVKVPR